MPKRGSMWRHSLYFTAAVTGKGRLQFEGQYTKRRLVETKRTVGPRQPDIRDADEWPRYRGEPRLEPHKREMDIKYHQNTKVSQPTDATL